ncbi:NAD(P)/FAD-dependent oxidoreductase [Rhizobium ruizarguesonis]|uniref:NAD(P)/FAD-dependent oxidoreductase n=1 Tax=Rhizobium ruizarguesonis TaxID=2081791 RepID=UPI00103013AD|nr:NAD(P)/FAD-dependent oxidoreductase [Rhizobium ruizarguesonis]TBA52712.1 NAD(P)/FAD-dependent oxidoreductase [Rhizobium ruizarguesonis]
MDTKSSTQVAVVGAGPAGATIARLLALGGRQVVLIDPASSVTSRLEILAPSSLSVIEALALTELLDNPSVVLPCAGIRRRWGASFTELDDFFRHPGGQGFVVDRAGFDARLRALAREAGVLPLSARATAVRGTQEGVEIEVSKSASTQKICAPIVVDASGRPSIVARRLGARRIVTERLVAERRFAERCEDPPSGPAWLDVEAFAKSWDYALSGPDGRREKWTVYRGHGRTGKIGPRVNASSSCLSSAAGNGWIAIGDAAAAFDPITSQGLVNALSSAIVAAGAIISPEGLSQQAASVYSEVMAATFANSERGRSAVYGALTIPK